MMRDDVLSVIGSLKGHAQLDTPDETDLIEDLGFTSLDVMNLILALEVRFAITFTDDDLELARFATVGAVLETLREYDVPAR